MGMEMKGRGNGDGWRDMGHVGLMREDERRGEESWPHRDVTYITATYKAKLSV